MVGLLVGFDYGWVWLDGENSDIWYYSYGGGIWLVFFDLVVVGFNYFIGDGDFGWFIFGGKFFF